MEGFWKRSSQFCRRMNGEGSERGGGEEWTEVMGKGKGKKCLEQKGST